ncbi:MAG: homocysteine S-methyltransferase family protein, partial [Clostridiales bacterium]|nr:homocysteine S-methyltransferase family protein [Clostridiales bacterium]
MGNILDAIARQTMISDGAMGTMLQSKGLPTGVSPEVWMLSHQETIEEVMTAYTKAGAHIIESNTFGANRLKLKAYGREDDVDTINAMAVDLAKKAAGADRFVAGVIGPSGHFPAPLGDIPMDELMDVFAQQALSLTQSGADLILLQTFTDLGEARAAYLGTRRVSSLPIAVSFTYDKNQRTLTGTDPETAATVFSALGADLLGVNCSTGPEEMLSIIRRYHAHCDLPLFAEPNAGVPYLENGQSVFPLSPGDMARFVPMFLASGVRILGGCCGTTPAHIEAIAQEAAQMTRTAEPSGGLDRKPSDGDAAWEPKVATGRVAALASRAKTVYLGAA